MDAAAVQAIERQSPGRSRARDLAVNRVLPSVFLFRVVEALGGEVAPLEAQDYRILWPCINVCIGCPRCLGGRGGASGHAPAVRDVLESEDIGLGRTGRRLDIELIAHDPETQPWSDRRNAGHNGLPFLSRKRPKHLPAKIPVPL